MIKVERRRCLHFVQYVRWLCNGQQDQTDIQSQRQKMRLTVKPLKYALYRRLGNKTLHCNHFKWSYTYIWGNKAVPGQAASERSSLTDQVLYWLYSGGIFWMRCSMENPYKSSFRIITLRFWTLKILGVIWCSMLVLTGVPNRVVCYASVPKGQKMNNGAQQYSKTQNIALQTKYVNDIWAATRKMYLRARLWHSENLRG